MIGNLQERVRVLDNARWHGGKRGAPPAIGLWHTSRSRMSALELIEWLDSTKEKKASYTYVIDRPGDIFRHCRPEWCAWHAGDSAWPHPIVGDGTEECRPNGGRSINAIALGFCFANADGEEITPAQRESGLWLAKVYSARYDIPPSMHLGHLEVSPGRKIDPECAANFTMKEWRRQIGALFG